MRIPRQDLFASICEAVGSDMRQHGTAVVVVMCSKGRHRSVAMAELLAVAGDHAGFWALDVISMEMWLLLLLAMLGVVMGVMVGEVMVDGKGGNMGRRRS